MLKKLIVCISLLFPVFVFATPTVLAPVNAIYRGDIVTSDSQFPFVVGIYKNTEILPNVSERTHCTGSIIDKRWVLTAAHCVMDFYNPDLPEQLLIEPKAFLIGTGHLAASGPAAKKRIKVDKIFVFDRTSNYMMHDVALLHLSEAVDIKPVALLGMTDDFKNLKTNNLPAIEVGYGWVNYTDMGPSYDDYLHFGDEIIQNDQTIQNMLDMYLAHGSKLDSSFNPISMIGVTSPDGKIGTRGDSGGPLLVVTQKDNSKSYVQVGVGSWGIINDDYHGEKKVLKAQPFIVANLTDRDILDFIYTTIKNNTDSATDA